MVNEEIQQLQDPDGTPVCNVGFDLSGEQLRAASHATGEMLVERHRGQEMDTDDVLALRQLTGVRDELTRLTEAGHNAAVVLPLARYIVLHDTLDEWVRSRTERDWLRNADRDALPILDAMLPPLSALRGEALEAALSAERTSH